MKVYPLDKITKDVRVALDQNMSSAALIEIGDVDTLSLDEIIRSKILDAVRRIHSDAPPHLIDGGYNFGDAVYWNDDGRENSGWVLLPEDFMRFVVFMMDDWERPAFSAIDVNNPLYARQSSRFKGIRGTPQKPVCAVSVRPEGRVLEFFSCNSEEAHVSRAVYLPYPKIDKYGAVEICSRCYDAIVYTVAALTLMTYGDPDKGNLFNELAKSSLI